MRYGPTDSREWNELRRALSGAQERGSRERLEALLEEEPLRTFLAEQYPSQRPRLGEESTRREFLKLMGASLALAGAGACTRQPEETIVPYARNPEAAIPGKPLFYATAMPQPGGALGILVESHEGRPTKVEGNAKHPASLGGTGVAAQASLLDLYDPDRARVVLRAGQIHPWSGFLDALRQELDRLEPRGGEGLALLVPEVLSPSLARQLRKLQEKLPAARVHQWQAAHRDHERRGAELAFGRDVSLRARLPAADVVLALDADFLAAGPAAVRSARDFFRRRREGTVAMSRLYAVETTPSLTGTVADHRLAGTAALVERVARALARKLGAAAVDAPPLDGAAQRFVDVLARDLQRGTSLVLVGAEQSPAVHALGHLLNELLGNVGLTVSYADPLGSFPVEQTASLRTLAEEMHAGRMQALVVLEGNPVYDAPADLDFESALERVPFRAHLSLQEDETSRLCHWHLPQAHFLESWGDVRAFDGTLSVVQPLIAPLYEGRSALEVAAALAGSFGARGYDLVRETWREEQVPVEEQDFERAWQETLHEGLYAASALPDVAVRVDPALALPPPPEESGPELCLRLDASAGDGRFAGNGWLQELPRPLTLLTWDNAVLLAPAKAAALGVATEDLVELTVAGRSVRGPVFVLPGQPEELVTVHLGYGRTPLRGVGAGAGFDAYPLRTSGNPWYAPVSLRKVPGRHALATVQEHARMEGRDLVRRTTWDAERRTDASAPAAGGHADASLYPPVPYPGPAWGMVIDLGACIGCNACTIACQAENNIPVVGKAEVEKGREMHWIRVDRYFEGEGASPETLHQPVPCMHCENAPCEVVCPVGATVHSSEGLNEMVYNRCVGTRYCSNNCPYKVRRFNFFPYADTRTESLKLGRNPDVTVRTRGVMEKCTYCVQRINEARIRAGREGRPIREGEVVTACQAVCPSEAIVFGDLSDPHGKIARLRALPRHYELLGELGVRPRTTYLARLRNPHPDLHEPG